MVRRDGKDKFYKKLKLDKETRNILRDYRELKEAMDKDNKPLEEDLNEPR